MNRLPPFLAGMLVLMGAMRAGPAQPVLCFSDLTSGPRTGNSDDSFGHGDQDGAIVTVWGKNLGSAQADSKIFANGAEAIVYSWGDATAPGTKPRPIRSFISATTRSMAAAGQAPSAGPTGLSTWFI